MLWSRIKAIIKRPFITKVSFARIRFDDKPSYVREGFGGKPIEAWPVYGFYELYLKGNTAEAAREYEEWYKEQFRKYRGVPKHEGGMQGGSLAALIGRLKHAEGISSRDEAPEELVRKGITLRVEERFKLVRSMQTGYNPNYTDLIYGVRRGDEIYIKNGHHRLALLRLMGYTAVPSVFVVPRWLSWLVER